MADAAAQWHFAWVLSVLHTGTTFGVWAGFQWLFQRRLAPRYQVAGGKAPNAELSRTALREVALGQALFGAGCYFVVYPLWSLGGTAPALRGGAWMHGGSIAAAWHGPVWMLVHLLAFVLVEDTIFYWAHRALHVPWLFRRVHARHHRFRFVRAHAAEYAHPLENLMNFVAFFAGPVLLHTPFLTLEIWIVVRMFETLEAHSGYAFTAGSSRHAFHHLHATRGCYGSFFSPWDRVMGTDREWRKTHASVTERSAAKRRRGATI